MIVGVRFSSPTLHRSVSNILLCEFGTHSAYFNLHTGAAIDWSCNALDVTLYIRVEPPYFYSRWTFIVPNIIRGSVQLIFARRTARAFNVSFNLSVITYEFHHHHHHCTMLQNITVMLRQWEARVNRIWDTAVRLRPLPLRIDGVQQPTPATVLCDYATSEVGQFTVLPSGVLSK